MARPGKPRGAIGVEAFEKSLSDRQRPGFLAGVEPDHSGETVVVRNHNARAGGGGEPKAADGHDAPKPGDDGLHDHRRAERRYHDARDH